MWLIVLVLLILGLVWLNGPGLRFFAPRIATHFLEKSGLRGNFKLSGNLVGGLSLQDLKIESDKGLAKLVIENIEPDYDFNGLRKGELKGLSVSGVHADLRLGVESEKKPEEKPPLDLKALAQTIRDAQAKFRPIRVEVKDIQVSATKDGKPVFMLASSNITHVAGTESLNVSLGTVTDPKGKVWPARQSEIVWTQDQLTIARIDPMPFVGIRDLALLTPAGGEPSLNADILLDQGTFKLVSTPGFATADLSLSEGTVQVDRLADTLGFPIPAVATLGLLDVHLEKLLPDPTAATGHAKLQLTNISSSGWGARAVGLEATLEEEKATVAVRAQALATPIALDATAPISRAGGKFLPGETTGTLKVANVPAAIRELAKKIPAIDPEAPVPGSTVDGNFRVAFTDNKPGPVTADLILQPEDVKAASPVAIKARWVDKSPLTAEAMIDGLKLNASYDLSAGSYQGVVDLDGFTNSRIDPWLAIVRVKAGGVGVLSGHWEGRGELKTGIHTGKLFLANATWKQPEAEQISAVGRVTYNWPGQFETQGLSLKAGTQEISLDANLTNGLLQMQHLLWKDGEQEMASGTASLPVPADFAQWRETLASDNRPLQVQIESRVLSLSVLKPWVPAASKLAPGSTGQLQIGVSGTYAVPVLNARLEARDLRSPEQPGLPPADLKLMVVGDEGKLHVEGEATAPDFPAATFKADMPFTPGQWAAEPEKITREPLTARLDLPRLDISRFASLVKPVQKLTGILTGNVTVTGTVGKPEPKGELALSGGAVDFKEDSLPDLSAMNMEVNMNLQQIQLKTLRSTVAGGALTGDGTVAIKEGKLGDLNFHLRGDHLPLRRDDSLIVRAMADLRLQGTYENATLSGYVATVDSVFFKDIEILPIGTPFTAPSAASLPKTDAPKNPTAGVPEPFRNWKLNVDLRTQDPFLVRGNLATGSATGRIKVGGTLGNPAPDGAVRIRDVRASLPFSTLQVREGYLRFTPQTGFDPVLEIRGNAEPRPYRVDVYVYGNLSNPQLVLTSNPPLPENEIMTLLATGTTTSGLEDPQAASSRAMQLLAEELRRGRFGIGQQLRPLLGLLDRVDFSLSEKDPYSSDSYSTATVSLTERWFVSAGMGQDGGSRVLGIWRLSFR